MDDIGPRQICVICPQHNFMVLVSHLRKVTQKNLMPNGDVFTHTLITRNGARLETSPRKFLSFLVREFQVLFLKIVPSQYNFCFLIIVASHACETAKPRPAWIIGPSKSFGESVLDEVCYTEINEDTVTRPWKAKLVNNKMGNILQ
jgi:hypothetical protein